MKFEYLAEISGVVYASNKKEALDIINNQHPTYCNIIILEEKK